MRRFRKSCYNSSKMLLGVTIFWGCVALVTGGRSPHAAHIQELFRIGAFGNHVSNSILEDSLLDMKSLVRKYGYPIEEHFVTTEDGYILGMHRIRHGRHTNTTLVNKPIAFLMHGLLCSSADYVTVGPGASLAYTLADKGFDVWMGNARGNTYSRRHITLNPDAKLQFNSNADFWRFSWDEIGYYDLPAMIDYVLGYTGKSRLHYIGFSQGTTAFFVMASLRPEYNNKIISMQAMAPVAYMEHMSHPVFRPLAPLAKSLQGLLKIIGHGELFRNRPVYKWLSRKFCKDGAIKQPLCTDLVFLFLGRNEAQHNATMLPVILAHTPAGCSVQQLVHYAQGVLSKEFRRYGYGLLGNLAIYGMAFPPRYDLSRISSPVFLHYAEKDLFAHVYDVFRLFRELGNPMAIYKIQDPNFTHGDFLYAIDVKKLVYHRVISIMKTMDRRYRSMNSYSY